MHDLSSLPYLLRKYTDSAGTYPKPYQGMKSTLSFPTIPENTTNHLEKRPSRERILWFHSLVGKCEGGNRKPMREAPSPKHQRGVRNGVQSGIWSGVRSVVCLEKGDLDNVVRGVGGDGDIEGEFAVTHFVLQRGAVCERDYRFDLLFEGDLQVFY